MSSAHELVQRARAAFTTRKTRSLDFRRGQLKALVKMLTEEKESFIAALKTDLNKPKQESVSMETAYCVNEIVNALNNLDNWAKPEKAARNMLTLADELLIRPEPYGVALILGAWNYPIQLIFLPLIGAMAAGNCCILKPSELAPATAELVSKLIPQYLDNDCYQVKCGGVKETTELLKEKFDYIFYTGNSMVGKIIMEAAAKNLTPVTLELGGKSPVYLHHKSDIQLSAQRIAWGKFMNSGQTCVAPDYVLCDQSIQDQFIKELDTAIKKFYGNDIKASPDYARVVNDRHFKRVTALMNEGKIVVGGETDEREHYIAPTVITGLKGDELIMSQEVFGPLLPIISVSSPEEAIEYINSKDKPLALYVFSNDRKIVDQLLDQTSSGGVCVNDTIMHLSVESMPFGGVGNSGNGNYHGKFTFDTFSHRKGCMIKKQNMEGINNKLRYPPYSESKLNWITWAMHVPEKKTGIWRYIPMVTVLALLAGFLIKVFGFSSRL